VICLVAPRRKVGTPRKLGLGSPRKTVLTQCYLLGSKHKQSINKNATNMCYMNAQKETGSDSENFGTRIAGFGVGVEKIWIFEVSGLFLWIFLRLGTFLELLFKFQGLTAKSCTIG
jgi:hypothetical protein